MIEPAVPRMPPRNRLAFAAGVLFVAAYFTISGYVQITIGFMVVSWAAIVVWRTWHSTFGRSLRRQIRISRFRVTALPAIVALQAKWSAQGIAAREVATHDEIVAFERETGIALPIDLRDYFAFVNGTHGGECGNDDENEVGFWHLKDIRSFADTHVSASPYADRTFAFADRSTRTAVYGVRLSTNPMDATPIFASLPSGCVQVATSFSEFVARYLSDPRSVLWPDFDVVAVDEGIGTDHDGIFTCSIRWQDVKAISIVVVSRGDGTVQAAWVIGGDEPVSPQHVLFVPVVLSARPTELTERLWALPGFDDARFRAAVTAEQSDQEGSFVCWRQPAPRTIDMLAEQLGINSRAT